MSAAEIIELIEKLPPEGKAEIIAFLEKKKTDRLEPGVRHLPQADAERIAEQIFTEHNELFRKLAQ